MNIAESLAQRVQGLGRAQAPAYVIGSMVHTHAEVHGLGARLATVLAERGVRPGDRVLLALPDGVELVALFLALARLGAMAVLVNPQLPVTDYEALVSSTRPVLTISDPDIEASAGPRWTDPATLCTAAERAVEASAEPVTASTPLYVQFTSGTTGRPRGAVHTHGDILPYHHAVADGMLGIGPQDVTLSISKMFFAYGFGNSLVYPLCSGSAAVLIPGRPRPTDVAGLIAQHGVTVVHGVPSAYANLLAETSPSDYRTVRVAVSAGESLLPPLGRRASELLGAPVLDELGSTEIGGACCANTPEDNELGTIGRPLRGYRLEVRDDSGQAVPPGVEGRLWVAGPTIMSGYLDDPAGTATAVKDGWLSTNDTAIRREDGRFEHTGRTDDIEVVGGINVSPREVEAVLLEHPAVRDVVVATVRNERGASKLRAFAVTHDHLDSELDLERELLTLARSRLAAFKVPRSVDVVPELPRTLTGKMRRFVVRTGQW